MVMICGWTILTSQHPLENDRKRQKICQIRHENCEWSTRFFKFVSFTRHSHVTGPDSQSNCIISGMCGPPGSHFLFIFLQMGPKSVVHPVLMSHKQTWKTGWTTRNFHALFVRSSAFYGHFQADVVTSESSTRIPSSSSLYSWYNN